MKKYDKPSYDVLMNVPLDDTASSVSNFNEATKPEIDTDIGGYPSLP